MIVVIDLRFLLSLLLQADTALELGHAQVQSLF